MSSPFNIRQLTPGDVPLMRALNALFGNAFGDLETYGAQPPSDTYLRGLLAKEHVIALVALVDSGPANDVRGEPAGGVGAEVAGGLVAYELDKFERVRREIYIYDLAVAGAHRRRGIATALIERLKRIAAERGAWVIYVQADYGDDPAIALYERMGTREEVLHFDIPPLKNPGPER